MSYRILLICILFILLPGIYTPAVGQVPATEGEARELLAEKGITEEELRAALRAKGYDLDNVDPRDIPELEKAVEDTIAELEAEKAAEKQRMEAEANMAQGGQDTLPPDTLTKVAPQEKPTNNSVSISSAEQPKSQIYGHHLFRSENARFYTQSSEVNPPETYVLGIGDRITVSIFGISQYEESLVIDQQGFVRPKNMFQVALRGKTLGEAKEVLQARYSQYHRFSPGEFSVIVNDVRNITINITGEANTTGAITIPAVNTIFNALVAAGGPSPIGSVRDIRLISGGNVKKFDLYKYMVDPSIAEEFYLRENDYIQIPVARKVVNIEGAVQRPMKYELLDKEDLKSLIEYAGGLRADAYQKDIQITRFSGDERFVININLRMLMGGAEDFILQNGDQVAVSTIEDKVDNFAEISGAVVKPGMYALSDEMRIADLLRQSGLQKDARMDYAYLLKYQPDGSYQYRTFSPNTVMNNPGSAENLPLASEDKVTILSLKTFSDQKFISVGGSVRNPGRYAISPDGNMQVGDALVVAGGPAPSASGFGYLIRRNPATGKPEEYIAFDLDRVLEGGSPSQSNLYLQTYDSIYVFSDSRAMEDFYVAVSGEVHVPGSISWDESLTLTDVLRMSGGLTYKAARNRIDISRVILSDTEATQFSTNTVTVDSNLNVVSGGPVFLNPFDHVFVRSVPDFKLHRTVSIQGEIRYPGSYPITFDNERLATFIQKAGGLTDEANAEGARLIRNIDNLGPVVINLQEAMKNPASSFNLILADNDELFIPKKEELVSIEGAVRVRELYQEEWLEQGNRINVVYLEGKNARFYIDKYAAGISDNGKASLVTVEHPNGRIERTVNLGLFRIYPKVRKGSTIKVGSAPPKPEPLEGEKEPVNWGEVVKDTLAQATAVLTLILLIDRASD